MNKGIVFWVKLIVTISLLLIAYFQLKSEISAGDIVESFKNIDMHWLGYAAGVYFISLIFSAVQWALLLRRQGIAISFFKAIRLYFVGLFFSNFLIGNIGGDLKRVYDVTKDSKKLVGSVTATLFDRIFGLYTLSLISVLTGLFFYVNDFELGKFVLPCFLIFVTLTFGFMALFSMRLGNQFEKLFSVGSKLNIMGKYHSLRECFQLFREPQFLSKILVFSLLTQALRIYTQVLMAKSLGLELDLAYYFFLVPIIGIATSLPISIGGFGPRELVAKELMTSVGWTPLQAVIWQFVGVLLNVFLGALGALEFLFGSKSNAVNSKNKSENTALNSDAIKSE